MISYHPTNNYCMCLYNEFVMSMSLCIKLSYFSMQSSAYFRFTAETNLHSYSQESIFRFELNKTRSAESPTAVDVALSGMRIQPCLRGTRGMGLARVQARVLMILTHTLQTPPSISYVRCGMMLKLYRRSPHSTSSSMHLLMLSIASKQMLSLNTKH